MADDSLLGNLLGNSNETNVKTTEINGKQYTFHSIPREIENATNSYYIMEKKNSKLEESIISKAFLYDIRLFVIKDAINFVLLLTLFLVSFSFKYYFGTLLEEDKFSVFLQLSTIIPFFLYIGMLIYTASHMKQYALIESHSIGIVTEKIKSYTSDVFFSTFFYFFILLQVAILIFFSVLHSMLPIFESAYTWLQNENIVNVFGNGPSSFIEVFIIVIKNGINLNSFYDFIYSFYFIHIILTIFSIFFLLIIKEKNYLIFRKQSEKEFFNDQMDKGYAFDKAMMIFDKIEKEKEENNYV